MSVTAWFEFLVGFVLPWSTFGVWFYRIDRRIVTIYAPVTALFAILADDLWFKFGYGEFLPQDTHFGTLSSVPIHLGGFALAGVAVVLMKRVGLPFYIAILVVSMANTVMEGIAYYVFSAVKYSEGWTLGWTFAMNVAGYMLIHVYDEWLIHIQAGESVHDKG